MRQTIKMILTLLITFCLINTTLALPFKKSNRLFTLHPCKTLMLTCHTKFGNHFVGYVSVVQFARMYHDRITCLPYGEKWSQLLIKKIVARCNKTYPFTCHKYKGCYANMQIKQG